jgi:hypothetical protein
METLFWISMYTMSVGLSWIMFRAGILCDKHPESHPQGILGIIMLIPIMNVLVSFLGMLFLFTGKLIRDKNINIFKI